MFPPLRRYQAALAILLALLGLSAWWISAISSERDRAAAELAAALCQLGWKDTLLARLSHPSAAQRAGEKSPASGPGNQTPEEEETAEADPPRQPDEGEAPALMTFPANLLWGPFQDTVVPVADGRTSLEEIYQLATLPPIEAGNYILKARLLNSKGELIGEVKARGDGSKSKIEVIREFPYPTRFAPPQIPENVTDSKTVLSVISSSDGSFPVTPSVPQDFAFKNTGWTVELAMSANGGLLQVQGHAENAGMEKFNAQPGETGKPIYDAEGQILTDNKQLEPSFTTRETPFAFDMLPGKTYRLPLNAADEGTILELSPVPVEK